MRKELEGRLAIVMALGMIIGLTAGFDYPLHVLFAIPVFLYFRPMSARWLLVLCLALGLVLSKIYRLTPYTGSKQIDTIATIKSMPSNWSDRNGFWVQDRWGLWWLTSSQKLPPLYLGDKIHIQGNARSETVGSHGEDLPSQGMRGRIVAYQLERVRRGPGLYHWVQERRESFVRLTHQILTPRVSALVNALCFNVTSELDTDTSAKLKDSGTYHIISASGLHVLILMGMLLIFFSQLPIPRSLQLLCIAGLLLLYGIAAGLNPPILRAISMALAYLAASFFRREPDLLSILCSCVFIFLFFDPYLLHKIGFQLSFLIVAILSIYGQNIKEYSTLSIMRYFWLQVQDVGRNSGVAALGGAPLTIYYFWRFPLYTVVANVLVCFVVAPIILFALLGWAIYSVIPSLGAGLFKLVVEPLSGWIFAVLGWIDTQPNHVIQFHEFNGYWLPVIYAILFLFWRPRVRLA